jgi:hypothetical protein
MSWLFNMCDSNMHLERIKVFIAVCYRLCVYLFAVYLSGQTADRKLVQDCFRDTKFPFVLQIFYLFSIPCFFFLCYGAATQRGSWPAHS